MLFQERNHFLQPDALLAFTMPSITSSDQYCTSVASYVIFIHFLHHCLFLYPYFVSETLKTRPDVHTVADISVSTDYVPAIFVNFFFFIHTSKISQM
jgi:hypothetical protein